MIESSRDFFDTLANILLRCWILGFALLMFAFVMILAAGGIIDDIHGRMFGLSPHELDVIFYCWLGALKLLVLIFFFIPWLAIRMVLRKKVGSTSGSRITRLKRLGYDQSLLVHRSRIWPPRTGRAHLPTGSHSETECLPSSSLGMGMTNRSMSSAGDGPS